MKSLEPKKMGQRNDLAVRKLSMITISTWVEWIRLISIVPSMEKIVKIRNGDIDCFSVFLKELW